MSQGMITGTHSSGKMDTLIGYRAIVRNAKMRQTLHFGEENSLIRSGSRAGSSQTKEFIKVCHDLQWNHDENTRHRSDTNGIAERAVRREQRQRWFNVADPMNGGTV